MSRILRPWQTEPAGVGPTRTRRSRTAHATTGTATAVCRRTSGQVGDTGQTDQGAGLYGEAEA